MTTATLTLTAFLLARIAEDEERAQFVHTQQGQIGDHQPASDGYQWHDEYDILYVPPARVLAESEAKRRIVEWMCAWQADVRDEGLRLLALPYADHPDYREEWGV